MGRGRSGAGVPMVVVVSAGATPVEGLINSALALTRWASALRPPVLGPALVPVRCRPRRRLAGPRRLPDAQRPRSCSPRASSTAPPADRLRVRLHRLLSSLFSSPTLDRPCCDRSWPPSRAIERFWPGPCRPPTTGVGRAQPDRRRQPSLLAIVDGWWVERTARQTALDWCRSCASALGCVRLRLG